MQTWKIYLATAITCLFGSNANAATFDGSESLICSLGQVIECDYGSDCFGATNESVDAPDFIKLNFDKNEAVASYAGEDGAPDDINVLDLDNHLIVQGVQGTSAYAGDALGWSMSINQTTGRMVLTGSGVNAGFVIFGACTQ